MSGVAMKKLLVLMTLLPLIACNAPQKASQSETPQVGRYVIVHSPQIERDTVLLDTVSGRTWQQVQITDLTDDPVAWEPLAREDNPDEWAQLQQAHPTKAKNSK